MVLILIFSRPADMVNRVANLLGLAAKALKVIAEAELNFIYLYFAGVVCGDGIKRREEKKKRNIPNQLGVKSIACAAAGRISRCKTVRRSHCPPGGLC